MKRKLVNVKAHVKLVLPIQLFVKGNAEDCNKEKSLRKNKYNQYTKFDIYLNSSLAIVTSNEKKLLLKIET